LYREIRKITRVSPLNGKQNTLTLTATPAQWAEFDAGRPRRCIQDVFPNMTPAEREFLLTGYTQADWDEMFPLQEEDEDEQ